MASPHLWTPLDFIAPWAVESGWILSPSNYLFSMSTDFILDIRLLKMALMALKEQTAVVVDPLPPSTTSE